MFTFKQVYGITILQEINKTKKIKEREMKIMSSIWSCINMKGGVSKSTSALNIGYELSTTYNMKVLLVDNDPQANLSIMLGIEPANLDKTIADVLISYNQKEHITMEDVMIKISDNLFLIPSTIDLAAADVFMQSVILGRERILGKALQPLLDKYKFDVVMIDNQPSLSLLPLNALACSDYIVVPCATEYLAYRGLGLIEDTFERVKENLNPQLKLFGVIASRHKSRNLHNKEVLELLHNKWNVIGVVPESTKIPDSIYHDSRSIIGSSPTSKPSIAYKKITKNIYDEIIKNKESE